MKKPKRTSGRRRGKAAAAGKYRLCLFISGATPRSTQAIANIKEIGEKRLHGNYVLEVIDAYQQAELVRDQQIVVLPTLIKAAASPDAADGRRPVGRGKGHSSASAWCPREIQRPRTIR